MRKKPALFLCLSLVASAPLSSQSADEVRQIIDRYNTQLERWYADGDIDAVISVFAEDAWQMPPNQPPLVGREAIREYWHQAVAWGDWEFNLEAQEVALSGPIAVERGKYVLEFTAGPGAPPGMASFEDRGSYLAHWRLESDGRWRIVGDAPVSELPPPCPQAAQEAPD